MAALPILELTDTQAVLGSAGISAGDVSDARLFASALEDDLSLHLYMRLREWETYILAGKDPNADTQAKMVALAISNYARYYCASIVASRWAYFKQLISDGKVRNDRFDRMDMGKMQDNIDGMRDQTWADLAELLPDAIKTLKPYVPFGISSPSYDPVTQIEE